ncbi:hypothetical protein Tco_0452724 [Tanacetum coccineum]
MAALKFVDSHNMVAYLKWPTDSDDFTEIVDFLNANPIRYAFTINPTIYVSCIEQFWSTAKAQTINEETQIHALVDGKKIVITESYELTSLKKRVKKLEQRGRLRTPGLKKLYKVGTSRRVESSAKASLGDQEDASKQGKNIAEIDADVDISLVHVDAGIQGRFDDEDMFDTSVFNDEEVFIGQDMSDQEVNVAKKEVSTADPITTASEVVMQEPSVDISTASVPITVSTATPTTPPTTITEDDMTLAETLIEIKSAKPKAIGVVMQEPSDISRISAAQQQIQEKAQGSRDKGKAKMVEEEEPKEPTKRKDQIKHDEELAQKLQAEIKEEDRLARQREEEDNIVS